MICRLENKNRNKTHTKNTLVVKEKGLLEIALLFLVHINTITKKHSRHCSIWNNQILTVNKLLRTITSPRSFILKERTTIPTWPKGYWLAQHWLPSPANLAEHDNFAAEVEQQGITYICTSLCMSWCKKGIMREIRVLHM